MSNKQTDLTDYLFEQLQYLKDRKLSGEKLVEEITRSKAIVEVSGQIIANGALLLSACRISETASRNVKLPLILTAEV
jgi:hypothetical protein